MKIAKLNIEGYIGTPDEKSIFNGEKYFNIENCKRFLNTLDSSITDIQVDINSGGGSVYDGWDIHNALQASGKTIRTTGKGIVGSIATVIFLSAELKNRKLVKGTPFFIHNPYWLPEESEPMRANELLALGKDLKEEQDKILNFYAKESKANTSDLMPLLEKETDLTAENAVKMGFASEVIEEAEEIEYHQYRLVAMIKPNKKNTDMKDEKFQEETTKKLNLLQRMFAKLSGKLLGMDLTVTNADGATVNLVIESDTEDLTDSPAFEVDAEGNRKPAEGSYVDADGKTIKVVSGKVTEVVAKVEDTPADDVAALKAEIETLKADKAKVEADLQAKTTEAETIKAEVEVIKPEFEALKKVIIGEGAEFDKGTQTFKAKKQEPAGSLIANEMAERIKNRHNK